MLSRRENTDTRTVVVKSSWLWTIAEPAVGVWCACLPTLRPLICVIFGSVWTKNSTKKSGAINESDATIAIGGRGPNPISRARFPKGKDEIGSFERLSDIEGADGIPVRLWPRGYCVDRETTVVGMDSRSALSDEIALGTIHVRNEVSLSEITISR